MKKYVTKVKEIEAIQWNGENIGECMKFLGDKFVRVLPEKHYGSGVSIDFETVHYNNVASLGEYIVKNEDGVFFSCSKDIFEDTYRDIEEILSFSISNSMLTKYETRGCCMSDLV